MTVILGVDPGLQHTGWGIISSVGSNLKFVAAGTISPQTDSKLATRIHHIYSHLTEVLTNYKPELAAVEEIFVNKNAQTSLKLGHARGTIMLTLAMAGLDVSEYATRVVKKAVVGVGMAEKKQVYEMVKLLLPGAKIDSYDAADALAVAICHANHK